MAFDLFPTLPSGSGPDSKKFDITVEDNTVSAEVEGGYTVSRPRTTRRARETYSVGYTYITEADRLVLVAFYQQTGGGGRIFQWVSPQNGVTYLVRFKSPMVFRYTGRLLNQRWDCSFTLQQA